MPTWIRMLSILGLPLLVVVTGGWLMTVASGRAQYPRTSMERPLNQRIGGYDAAAVVSEWNRLGGDSRHGPALAAERRMLELDLVFPFAYGGALAAALLLGWAGLGRPFPPVLIVVPVTLLMAADWTENLTQLTLLDAFQSHGPAALGARFVAVASVATQLKVLLLIVAMSSLVVMAACQIFVRRQ